MKRVITDLVAVARLRDSRVEMLCKLGLRLCYSGKLCGAGIHTVSEEHLTQYYNSLRHFKSRGHMVRLSGTCTRS